jgi:hypothetical protein
MKRRVRAHCCERCRRAGQPDVHPSEPLRRVSIGQREGVPHPCGLAIGRSRMASRSLAFGRDDASYVAGMELFVDVASVQV